MTWDFRHHLELLYLQILALNFHSQPKTPMFHLTYLSAVFSIVIIAFGLFSFTESLLSHILSSSMLTFRHALSFVLSCY